MVGRTPACNRRSGSLDLTIFNYWLLNNPRQPIAVDRLEVAWTMNDIPPEASLQPAPAELTGHPGEPRWVVGIGAGAGGLEAIQLLFGAMPADARMAFVICRHVQSGLFDPLADLLCTQTSMPVVRAEDGTRLEAGRIHLVSPAARMILLKDRLVPFTPEEGDDAVCAVTPIDMLLHSLAASAGTAAIAVVLSGRDKDGVAGCASIRSHGGLVLAQLPDSTEFADMPRRVIDAGLASAVAPPGAIPDLIRRHVGGRRQPADDAAEAARNVDALARISDLLEHRFALDLKAYRPSLIAKRVRRRLVLAQAPSLAAYAERLAGDEAELAALQDDILLRVTGFFRDPEAYAALERQALPVLIARMSEERPIRVWVPAAASGEEPYSLAMLLLDGAERAGKAAHVEVIASDRHGAALEQARAGLYARACLDQIPERLGRRYLQPAGAGIAVGKALRRHVTFIQHDILKAPPPDGIDLVSCRNLLIYLAPAACEHALKACDAALNPGGFLLLGASEQPGARIADFEVVDGKRRLYRKATEPPLGQALGLMSEAYRRRPAETLRPKPDQRDDASMRPAPAPEAPAADPCGERGSGRIDKLRLLDSTLDTLMSSHERLRRSNRDLRAENQRLLRVQAALDDVATMIAHDLKAPLRAIERLAADLEEALDARPSGDHGRRWLQPMRGRLAALGQVIDDLLTYAREDPADEHALATVDFGELLRRTLTLIGLPTGVRVMISPPVLTFRTWQIPLACILRSLLSQAVERLGGKAGVIRIEAAPEDGFLEIAVSDDGTHGADAGVEASAELGLAIVRQLVEAAGGRLSAETEPRASGRQVRFRWPVEGRSAEGAVEAPPPR
jgi:chemotaxis methyl-accepting protein methylase/two-component sensor histidine kinase